MMPRLLLIALLFVMCTVPARAEESKIRALLIGINNYLYPGWPRLGGCQRDVQEMQRVLTTRFGAPPDRVRVLDERLATRSGIEGALEKLLVDARPGDTVIFAYSGHGASVADRDPRGKYERRDETNGLDECLIPIDAPNYKDARFPDAVVRDDFIEDMLAALVQKVRAGGAPGSVVFIFDSCHSGGMSRAALIAGQSVRTVPEANEYFSKNAAGASAGVLAQGHRAGREGWVVLAACRSDQQARDSKEGGVFTQTLLAALQDKRLTERWNYTDLMQLVTGAPGLQQSPQSDGDRALRIFGGTAQPRKPGIAVLSGDGARVTLDQGTLVGVTPGSRIAIYRHGTHSPDEKAQLIAEAVVESEGTSLYGASAKLTSPASAADLRSAVAWIAQQSFGDSQVRAYFVQDVPAVRKLMTEDMKTLVEVVKDPKQADLLIFASGPNGEKNVVSVERPGQDRAPLIVVPAASATLAMQVREAVEAQARKIVLARMINAPDTLQAALVPGEFKDKSSIGSFVPDPGARRGADGLPVVRAGSEAVIEVTNTGTSPLYVSILDILSGGQLDVLYPAPVEQAAWKPLAPGAKVQVDLGFEWPREAGAAKSVTEGFKILGTAEKIDLQFLCSRGTRSATAAPQESLNGPFGQLMSLVVSGTRAGRVLQAEPKSYVGLPVLWVRVEPR